jgi:hypothetical protein
MNSPCWNRACSLLQRMDCGDQKLSRRCVRTSVTYCWSWVRRRMLDAAKVVAMEQAFQIVSVDRSLTNWGHYHITSLDTAPKPGSPDRWSITSVLGALAAGDLFYTISRLGDPAFARPYRCMCGFATVRATPAGDTKDGLESLSADQWETKRSTPASF